MKRKISTSDETTEKSAEKRKKQDNSDSALSEIVKALESKPNWETKIFDDTISSKWRKEALDQGASNQIVDRAFSRLRFRAARQSEPQLNSMGSLKEVEYPDEDGDEEQGFSSDEEQFDKDTREPQEGDLSKVPRSDITYKDNIIPESLRQQLEQQLDQLAEAEPKDYHPGSNQTVLNLFHPSNFPYVRGISIEHHGDDGSNNREGNKKYAPRLVPKEFREEVNDPFDEDDGHSETSQYSCDKCSAHIAGNAYLCRVCRDFSLCEKCQNEVFGSHTADHPMVTVFTTFVSSDEEQAEDEEDDDSDEGKGKKKKSEGLGSTKKPKEQSIAEKLGYTLEALEDIGYGDSVEEEDKEAAKTQKYMQIFNSVYQWLPAEYTISRFGTQCKIDSYINGLDPKKYSNIYSTLEQVFQHFIPLIQSVVDETNPIPFDTQETVNLQVITKAANYILKPGQAYRGSWHVEGVPQEHIIASGIYYYSTDKNLTPEATLLFRSKREDETNYTDRGEAGQDEPFSINLGFIPTTQGRCVAFENLHLQHKVRGLKNHGKKNKEDKNKDKDKKKNKKKRKSKKGEEEEDEPKKEIEGEAGTRKILCFFVVDPKHRIIGTREVREQRWDKIKGEVALALCAVNKRMGEGKREGGLLPVEVLMEIMKWSKWGFTTKEAEEHRERLMYERKYFVDMNNQVWERRYSFCEH